MWEILEIIVLAAIGLIAVTEFFIPIILNKPLFGSFRKVKIPDASTTKGDPSHPPLKEKISQAKEKVEEVKEVQGEVTENFKSAKELKKESDDLLK